MAVRDTSIDPRLLESAREEFMEKGFLKADLKTICDKAGVTTGAVYKRYKGKEELFCAVVKDATEILSGFVDVRSDIDFSGKTDEEILASWTMTEENMMPLFKMLWKIRDEFVLLLDKSAGTSYEYFGHDFAIRMTDTYMQYYEEAVKRGLTTTVITKKEMHILCTSFWTAVYEPFVHGMKWKDMEDHCKTIYRFFDWSNAIGIKR